MNDDLPLPELNRVSAEVGNQVVMPVAEPKVVDGTQGSSVGLTTQKEVIQKEVAKPVTGESRKALEERKTESSVAEQVEAASAKPEVTSAKATVGGSMFGSLGGSSIMSLLSNKGGAAVEVSSEVVEEVEDSRVDPESEQKIMAAKEGFVARLMAERQRVGVAFGEMSVGGNVVKITVGSDDLRQEILRSQYEILSLLAEMADVRGAIELEVSVTADKQRAEILIKPEDKVHYLCEQNPAWLELRTALDLDIE